MGCSVSTKKVLISSLEPEQLEEHIEIKPSPIAHAEELKFDSSNFILHKLNAITSDYKIESRIGSGAFGSVYKATHKPTGQIRAIKSVQKLMLTKDMKQHTQFFNEIDILRKSDHPNIVKMFEFYEDHTYFHIVTEFMPGGELFDFILRHQMLSEPIAAHFLRQILSAVSYCHANGVVHRDIKPENLLLDSSTAFATLKVIDFGTSTLYDTHEKLHLYCGTPYYIAPEVLNKDYDCKCDIWSCGVILYILLSGSPPFNGKDEASILNKVRKGKFSFGGVEWKRISSAAKNLIKKMLDMDPENRPSAIEVIHDPWFENVASPGVGVEIMVESLGSLKKFHADEKLQQAVLGFITSQLLSKEDTEQLNSMFRSLDTNGDGKLSKEELVKGCSDLFNSIDEVESIMKEVDTDQNGYIEYSEFVMATVKKERMLSMKNLETVFALFDLDGSGTISAVELKQILGNDRLASDNVWAELINQVDLNGDGEIDIKEFKEMMLKCFALNS